MKDKELLVYPQKKEDENFNKGLTLRDYFAAKAIQGSMNDFDSFREYKDEWFNKMANFAYKMADTMLKVRKDSSPD